MMQQNPLDRLRQAGRSVRFWRCSALDRYHGLACCPVRSLLTDATLVELVKIFDEVTFPALPRVSAEVRTGDGVWRFFCVDCLAVPPPEAIPLLGLLYDPARDVFPDPYGVYPQVRIRGLHPSRGTGPDRLLEEAILSARYPYSFPPRDGTALEGRSIPPAEQRELLLAMLTGAAPWLGLEHLRSAGFLARYWPELAALAAVDHDKDFHPEGDGWHHSLEALRQRNGTDPVLSLALLLHDIGKTVAERNGERAFDEHSRLGAVLARDFLRRLEFAEETVQAVFFLVQNHMIPPALHRMPGGTVERIMGSPLYPRLLELYRADLLATWADDADFHEAYRQYKRFLKHSRNPFRDARGLVRRY